MSIQLAHQLGAAKLPNPAAPANNSTAEMGAVAWLPANNRIAAHVIPRNPMLCRPRRRPKRETALSESHPPNKAISVIARNGVVPQKTPFAKEKPRTFVR